MIDIEAYLKSKGVEVRAVGENELQMPCFYHGEEVKNKKLYVNIDPTQTPRGLHMCHVCGVKGTFNSIRKHFGDSPIDFTDDDAKQNDLPDDEFCRIMTAAAEYYHLQLSENEEVIDYLTVDRGFKVETLQSHLIGYADGGIVTHLTVKGFDIDEVKKTGIVDEYGRDSLKGMITIPYQVRGQVVQIRGRRFGDHGPKYKTCGGNKSRLFNQDAANTDDAIIITEGEFDCLTLEQLGFPHVVALPGCENLQDDWLPYFSMARRIVLCLDNDARGRKAAEKHATTFGAKARIAELPEDMDVNKWFVQHGKGKEDFEYIFSKSKGGILVSVRECYDRWLEVEGNPNLAGLRFGIDVFDDKMRHGMLPGQVIVPLSKTGCLTGDTVVGINRAGKGFSLPIKELYEKFHGSTKFNGKQWDRQITTKAQCAIEGDIRLGDVADVVYSGAKVVYRLSTLSGRSIKGTKDHRFFTPSGWKRLEELDVGDEVFVNVGRGSNVLEETGIDVISLVTLLGVEDTYDICMVDEPHNFVANEFVVHNSGKTISTLNLFQRMSMIKPDIKILFISLEQTRNEWFERAQRIHSFYDLSATRADTIAYWETKIFLIDENRLRYEQISDAIEQYTYEMGAPPDFVAIDYLGYYARGYKGDAYERTSAAAADMKRLAKSNQTVIYVPHQVNRNADFGKEMSADMARDSGAIEEYADMIIGLWAPDQKVGTRPEDKENELHMKILKVRDGGKDTVAVLQFAPLTLAMVPVTDKKYYGRAFAETKFERNGDSWEQAVIRHKTGDFDPFSTLAKEQPWVGVTESLQKT